MNVTPEIIDRKAIEHLEAGGETFAVTMKFEQDATLQGAVEFTVPVGAVCLIEVVVFVNGQRVPVLTSTWTLNGRLIDWQKAIQTRNKSFVPTVKGPIAVHGGMSGNPALIAAAWAGPTGAHHFTVSGTVRYQGRILPFSGEGTTNVQAPPSQKDNGKLNLVWEAPELDGPVEVFDFEGGRNLGLDVGDDNGIEWRLTKNDAFPGSEGFVQVIRKFIVARSDRQDLEQLKGIFNNADYPALDANHPAGFYDDEAVTDQTNGEATIEDSPFEPLHRFDPDFEGREFIRYARSDAFTTYVAWRVLPQGAIIEAFLVACAQVQWGWKGAAQLVAHAEHANFVLVEDPPPEWQLGPIEQLNWDPIEWNTNGADAAFNTWEDVEEQSSQLKQT